VKIIDDNSIEKMILQDSKNIKIDNDFKANLKKQIMSQNSKDNELNNVIKLTSKKKNYKFNKYLKIASSFAIVAFIGGNFIINANNLKNDADLSIETKSISIAEAVATPIATPNYNKDISKAINMEKDKPVNNEVKDTEVKDTEVIKPTEENGNASINDDLVQESLNDSEIDKNHSPVQEVKDTQGEEVKSIDNDDSNIDIVSDGNDVVDDRTDNNQNDAVDSKINSNENSVDENQNEGKYEFALEDNNPIDKEVNLNDSEMDLNINEGKKTNVDSTSSKFDESDIEELFKKDEHTAASPNLEKSFDEVPLMENIKEDNKEMVNCYDSRYSQNGEKMLIIKEDGIYIKNIKNNNEEKVISSENEILERANFMSDDCIIYSKAKKTDSDEYKHTIYEYNIVDSTNNKIEDGKNPVISKDGNKLAYEFGGKIRVKNLKTEAIDIIDDGQYPSWSPNGKFLSYVKIQSEKESFDETTEQKKCICGEEIFKSMVI
jgi:hypothetical protein